MLRSLANGADMLMAIVNAQVNSGKKKRSAKRAAAQQNGGSSATQRSAAAKYADYGDDDTANNTKSSGVCERDDALNICITTVG